MWARIAALLAAALASFALTGAGQVTSASRGPEDPAAGPAVAVLTGIESGDALEAVPDDFAEVMGYVPVTITDPDGSVHVVAPDGGCSSPFGATAYDFDRACRTHDFGYDLLRYATVKGGELGPWARMAIDDQLGSAMRARCDAMAGGSSCDAVAAVSESVVKANSWRQGYGYPGVERPGPYLASAALIVAAIAGPPVAKRLAAMYLDIKRTRLAAVRR